MFYSDVTLIDYMPDNEAKLGLIAQGSRGKSDEENALKTLRFCVNARHLSVLEFAQIVFKIQCPIFVARQLMRYRTASYLERSLRYCEPTTREWMKEIEDPDAAATAYSTIVAHEDYSRTVYDELVQQGMKKEQARAVLPLSTETSFFMRIDLRNLLHIFDERLTKFTQAETREVVESMRKITSVLFPTVCQTYQNSRSSSPESV